MVNKNAATSPSCTRIDWFGANLYRVYATKLCRYPKLSLEDAHHPHRIHKDAECQRPSLFPREPVMPGHEACSTHQGDHDVSQTRAAQRGHRQMQERRGDKSDSREKRAHDQMSKAPMSILRLCCTHADVRSSNLPVNLQLL